MKQTIAVLLVVLLAFTGSVYFLIPATHSFAYATETNCTDAAVERFITNQQKWTQWWPGAKKDSNTFSYKQYDYRITKRLLNGFEAVVSDGKISVKGDLHFSPGSGGAVALRWESVFINTGNPVSKLISYIRERKLKENIEALLNDVKAFFDDEKNVYGFRVSIEKVTTRFLVHIKEPLDHYPSMQEAYDQVNEIKNYIRKKGGVEKNPPMLNVYSEKEGSYELMVAIPTTTAIPGEGKFLYREMVLGNILAADVLGGIFTIKKGEQELTNYLLDHNKTSPASPYQSMITNRTAETDTTRWVTKLYYPVFY